MITDDPRDAPVSVSFARELAKQRHSADRAASALIVGLVAVGAGAFIVFKDGANAFAYGAIILGVLLLCLGGILFAVRSRRVASSMAIVENGVAVEGTVSRVRRARLSRDYVLHFDFRDPFGKAGRGRQTMSQEEAFTWREGDKGAVRLDPRRPEDHIWIGRGILFEEEDEDNQLSTMAAVTAITPNIRDGERSWWIDFRYQDHLGHTHEGRFTELGNDEAPWRVGDTGQVRFGPERPEVAEWVGRIAGHLVASHQQGATSRDTLSLARGSEPSLLRFGWRSRSLRKAALRLVPAVLFSVFLGFMVVLWASGQIKGQGDLAVVGAILGIVVFFFVVPCVWSAHRGLRDAKEWRRVWREGVPTRAVVSLVKETFEEVRMRRGAIRKHGWIISYRYQDQSGATRSGQSGYLPRREASAYRVGDQCVIAYDVKQPDKSVWIGCAVASASGSESARRAR